MLSLQNAITYAYTIALHKKAILTAGHYQMKIIVCLFKPLPMAKQYFYVKDYKSAIIIFKFLLDKITEV